MQTQFYEGRSISKFQNSVILLVVSNCQVFG